MKWTRQVAHGVLAMLMLTTVTAHAATINVSGGGAALQNAINTAVDGDVLRVAPGTYSPISTSNKRITIEGTGSVSATIINGGSTNRCATLGTTEAAFTHTTNTVLTGFTLRNGNADHANVTVDRYRGGGSHGGTLNNCTLSGNTAGGHGGGSAWGTLNNCWLTGNTAGDYGGGSLGGTLNNCILSGNKANQGGGSYYGILNNCTLSGNRATSRGGGSYGGTLNNCTLTGNTAVDFGGGSYGDTLRNCIIWNNTITIGSSSNYSGGTITYSCTAPLPAGAGNISADPRFVNATSNFRLLSTSPCINTGNNADAPIGDDLDGYPRIQFDRVDMGAYESQGMRSSPGNVTASTDSTSLITFSWNNVGALSYDVLRNTVNNSFTASRIGTTTGTSFNDTTAAAGVTYYYWVRGIWTAGVGPLSQVAQGWRLLAAPTGVSATNNDTARVTVSWSAVPGATSYKVFRSASHLIDRASEIGTTTATSFNDTTATPGIRYCYWVKAVRGANESDFSTRAVGIRPLATPTGLTASSTHSDRVALAWGAVAGAASYRVFRNTVNNSGGAAEVGTATSASFSDAGATPGVTYYYWVQAISGVSTVNGFPLRTESGLSGVAQGVRIVIPAYLSGTGGATSPLVITTAYDGFLYESGSKVVRGTLTLNAKAAVKVDKKTNIATTNWTFSAKAMQQHATISFSGKFVGAATRFTASTKNNAETLDVQVKGNRCYGTLSGGKMGGTLTVDGARNAFADKKDAAAQARLDKFRGLHNIALKSMSGGAKTEGSVSLSVGNAGAVKLAGALEDGTKVSGSAKLLDDLNADNWCVVALHRPLYSKKGFIGGLLWLDPVAKVIRVDTGYGWYVLWGDKELRYHEMWVIGGYFGDGKVAPAVPPGLKFYADVPSDLTPPVQGLVGGRWVSEAIPWSGLSITYGTAGKLSLAKGVAPKLPKGGMAYDYGGPNPSLATLTYTPKTGIFKGSFKLHYDGNDAAKGTLVHKTLNVPYSGVMVPDGGKLSGAGPGTVTINKDKVGVSVFLQ